MDVRPGVYRHYKNKDYAVLGCAKHTETGEEVVVYRALYGAHELWVRPKDMFLGQVTIQGRVMPRFQYVGDEPPEGTGDAGRPAAATSEHSRDA